MKVWSSDNEKLLNCRECGADLETWDKPYSYCPKCGWKDPCEAVWKIHQNGIKNILNGLIEFERLDPLLPIMWMPPTEEERIKKLATSLYRFFSPDHLESYEELKVYQKIRLLRLIYELLNYIKLESNLSELHETVKSILEQAEAEEQEE